MVKTSFKAACNTTAMAVMPHTDIERALDLALSLDVPFWPQLARASFKEDMYVQASENFPGVAIDYETKQISFDSARFAAELPDYSQRMIDPETFALSRDAPGVYYRFLARDLKLYPAVHGQVCGPINLGFRLTDETGRPIIYNDEVRAILFDFIQRKVNVQYHQLREKNRNAFVWMDEPGLVWVFSGLSGYNDVQARQDYQAFLAGLDGPWALHLCSNVNLPYLLELGVEFVSFDAYQLETMPKGYADSIAAFIKNGGTLSWGMVPTEPALLSQETPEKLADRLLGYWEVVSRNTGLPVKQIAEQALVAPAKCCIKSIQSGGTGYGEISCVAEDSANVTVEEQSVETAFAYLRALSGILKARFGLTT